MNVTAATFEVQDVFHITGRTETYLAGKIKTSVVREDMPVKVLVDSGPFMFAKIKNIAPLRDLKGRCDVALALDPAEEEMRLAWKQLCRSGDILAIEEEKDAISVEA